MSLPTITKIGENITQIGDKVRVEVGPKLLEAIATEELLSDDVTAGHYQVGRRDSVGDIIVLGEPMKYLAWGGRTTPGEQSHYVYQVTPRPVLDEAGAPVLDESGAPTFVDDPNHWVLVDAFDTPEQAMAQAGAIAASL